MKRIAILLFSCFEILIIIVLLVFLGIRRFGFLREYFSNIPIFHWNKYYISPIKKENLIFPETASLQHYYESTTSSNVVIKEAWMTEGIVNTYNADGLNERYDYSVEVPQHTYRIMTLGDSFTLGESVNTANNWTEQLEDLLNMSSLCNNMTHFEVINLGLSGYDMQYELEHFKTTGVKYNPDLVIWFLNADRWNELQLAIVKEKESQMTEKELADARVRGEYYPAWVYAAQYVDSHYSDEQKLEQSRVFMREFTNVYDKKLLIMTLPNGKDTYKTRLQILAKERGINTWYFDALPELQQGVTMLPDGHPNEKGHTLYAETIYQTLVKEKLTICR